MLIFGLISSTNSEYVQICTNTFNSLFVEIQISVSRFVNWWALYPRQGAEVMYKCGFHGYEIMEKVQSEVDKFLRRNADNWSNQATPKNCGDIQWRGKQSDFLENPFDFV